jgi:NAD(P)-dependent dehydrogenase (short-subunit alcohol dehydrogenase family)
MSNKTIVITGSSSGIGRATAAYFAEQGWNVAATMRKPENETELKLIENVSLYQLDVTDDASIAAAVHKILDDLKRVDVVLNNAGYGLTGPFEAATVDQIRRQFDTNVFGLMSVTRAFLPHFRANGAGLFINISSIGGLVSFPFVSLYNSTKWAVEGFSESLLYELNELGIRIKIIEPGVVATDFFSRSLDFASKEGLIEYNDAFARSITNARPENRPIGGSTPHNLAEAIYQAATDGTNRLRYVIGPDAGAMYELRKTTDEDAFIAEIKKQRLS